MTIAVNVRKKNKELCSSGTNQFFLSISNENQYIYSKMHRYIINHHIHIYIYYIL